MPSCVLLCCKNRSVKTNKSDGVTFHKFPRPGLGKREKWIMFVQKNRRDQTWLPSDSSVICSAHFKVVDKYTTKFGLTRLKNTAVPCENPISAESDDEEVFSVAITNSDCIFDTPKIMELKKKIRKESAAKQKLTQKIKKMQKQNIYFKKKCESYKTLVENLKSNFSLNLSAADGLVAEAEEADLHQS